MMYLADIFRGAAASRGKLLRGWEAKFDGDVFLGFDGLAVESSGFISPPSDGVDCSRRESWGTGEGFYMDDLAICSDGGAQSYIAFDMVRARGGRIARSDMINQRARARLRGGCGWRLRI
jgi:hypothetical protein